MFLTNVRIARPQAKHFAPRRRSLLPCALSLVLASQCLSLNMLQLSSAAWAAEEMPEAAAPSWNEVTTDSTKTIDAVLGGTASGAAARTETAKAETYAAEPEKSSGDGKSIAEATHVGGSTSADAAILRPAQLEPKEESHPEAAKAGTAGDAMVVDSDAGATSAAKSDSTKQAAIDSSATNSSSAPALDGALVETTSQKTDRSSAQSAIEAATTASQSAPSAAALSTPIIDVGIAQPVTEAIIAAPSSSSLLAPAPVGTNLVTTPAAAEPATKAPPQVGTSGALGTVDSLSGEMFKALGATVTATDTASDTAADADGTVMEGGVMVVDCDEKAQVQEEIKYENLETDEAKTHIKAGAVFPVVVSSQISSKTAKKGDALEARLKYDLKIGDRLIARKGAEVHGHINYSLKARSAMHSLISPERWYRNSGCLGVEFDEIINEKGEHLPLVACPARTSRIVKNKNEGRVLGVNHLGQITGPWSQQLRYKAIRIGLNAAMAPAGVFSFGAMPVALGLIGAANPSFAFMKPIGNNVRHRRLKGFAWGFLSGVPGSWIIEDTVVKGQESIIKPGDEFLAEFRQEFNGEPASEAQLMPNASVKVHGQVSGKDNDKGQDKGK